MQIAMKCKFLYNIKSCYFYFENQVGSLVKICLNTLQWFDILKVWNMFLRSDSIFIFNMNTVGNSFAMTKFYLKSQYNIKYYANHKCDDFLSDHHL